MELEEKAKTRTKFFENTGDPTRIHRDHLGNLTIGYGFLAREGVRIPLDIVDQLFEFKWQEAKGQVNALLDKHEIELDEVRKIALVDMCYNMGAYNLSRFSKMLFALKVNDYETAGIQLIESAYGREPQLRKQGRPQANMHMLITGTFPNDKMFSGV